MIINVCNDYSFLPFYESNKFSLKMKGGSFNYILTEWGNIFTLALGHFPIIVYNWLLTF